MIATKPVLALPRGGRTSISWPWQAKFETTHTAFLEETIRIILPAYSLQKPPITLAVTFKRLLPLRAIVQVAVRMACAVSHRSGLDLLDCLTRLCLDEFVVSLAVPVDGETHHDQRVRAIMEA